MWPATLELFAWRMTVPEIFNLKLGRVRIAYLLGDRYIRNALGYAMRTNVMNAVIESAKGIMELSNLSSNS